MRAQPQLETRRVQVIRQRLHVPASGLPPASWPRVRWGSVLHERIPCAVDIDVVVAERAQAELLQPLGGSTDVGWRGWPAVAVPAGPACTQEGA